jgi:hypothetical protein
MSVDRVMGVLKRLIGDTNESKYTQVGSMWLSHHDCCHLEVSSLPALPMGRVMVTGIAGVCIPEFGNAHHTPEYDGQYDECRVAIHQALVYPSPCGYLRLFKWYLWMMSRGINPISTVMVHKGMLCSRV